MLFGKSLAIFGGNPPLGLSQICFISYQHYYHVRVAMLLNLCQPFLYVGECVSPCNVVDQESSGGASIELSSDTFELLLAGRVVYLQFDISHLFRHPFPVIFDFDHARPKVDSNCQVMLCAEPLVCELHEQAALTHARIANDDVLEQK
jgi:hypothetical protein